MTTGERIKNLRKKENLSQTELGEKIGVTINTISKIELNKSDISGETLKKASELFKVSTDYLLKGIETEQTISKSEQEMLEVLRENKAVTNAVMEIAKAQKKAINYLGGYTHNHAHAA